MSVSEKFGSEAAMYAPAATYATVLASTHDVCHFFQVKATTGIPDLVLAVFDQRELDHRVNLGLTSIVDSIDVAVMLFLNNKSEETKRTVEIAHGIGTSTGYLSSIVLPRLVDSGHIIRVTRGKWRAVHQFRPTVSRIVTVEAKVSAWKMALWQAQRHARGADMAWVLLDETEIGPALRNLKLFRDVHVGIAGLSPNSITIHQPAPARMYRNFARAVLAERVTYLYMNKRSTWEWTSMFGAQGSNLE